MCPKCMCIITRTYSYLKLKYNLLTSHDVLQVHIELQLEVECVILKSFVAQCATGSSGVSIRVGKTARKHIFRTST